MNLILSHFYFKSEDDRFVAKLMVDIGVRSFFSRGVAGRRMCTAVGGVSQEDVSQVWF